MKHLLFFFLISLSGNLIAQHTFSIVAIDTATGEVGSAGASCISNSKIISDLHANVGAVHTQALWNPTNQNLAKNLMNQGFSPQQIIDSVVAADVQNDSTVRQYGAVDFVGGGRSAGHTGSNTLSYANHVLGQTYAIQGNILLGQEILDSMETRFLNTPGPLCDKLMAALQGANVPGADTRCLPDNKPALSAFIRVAKPEDTLLVGVYWLDLNQPGTTPPFNPIDEVQMMFDAFKATHRDDFADSDELLFQVYPNPSSGPFSIQIFDKILQREGVNLKVHNAEGKQVWRLNGIKGLRNEIDPGNLASGIYFVNLEYQGKLVASEKLLVK